MRVGYLFRGYLGDVKLDVRGNSVSSPDGNATYSWAIAYELLKRDFKVVPLGENLDAPAAERMGTELFASFSKKKRSDCYVRMCLDGWLKGSHINFPELDLLLVEWRWPIQGRNTQDDKGKPWFQNDLERQNEVLRHYLDGGTPVVVWDLDHKVTLDDEMTWGLDKVIETSVEPRRLGDKIRAGIEPPFVTRDLLQHDIVERMPKYNLGYIGSRYERDEVIDEWIAPITPPNTHRAKFWGKWEPVDDVSKRWPGIMFGDRICTKDFRDAYSVCAAVPLLAKESYMKTGFMTPRVWESVLFGSIPIGLNGHLGIERYCERVAKDPAHLLELTTELRVISPLRRRIVREEAAHRLSFMDARHFVDRLLSYAENH